MKHVFDIINAKKRLLFAIYDKVLFLCGIYRFVLHLLTGEILET